MAHDPGVITSALCEIVTVPPQLSLAVTAASLAAGTSPAQLTVVFAGIELITGAVLSSTVMVCDAVAVLPHASIAVHVLVILYSLAHVPGVVTSLCESVDTPHASDAVGDENDGVAGQLIVCGPPTPLITGAV